MRVLLIGVLLLGACGPSVRMVHDSTTYFERCHAADFDPTLTTDQKEECWGAWLEHYAEAATPDRVEYAKTRHEALGQGRALEPLPGVPDSVLGTSYTAAYLSSGSELKHADEGVAGDPAGAETSAEGATVAGEAADTNAPGSVTEATSARRAEPHVPGNGVPGNGVPGNGVADSSLQEHGVQESRASDAHAPADGGRTAPAPVRETTRRDPAPPDDGASPCNRVCNPRWHTCARACSGRGGRCLTACESEYRICLGACY